MWTWSLNWGRITDRIVIGTCPISPGDLGKIYFNTGASGVLSLQDDDDLAYWGIDDGVMRRAGTGLGLKMERCPIRDFDIQDMRRQLPSAVSRLADMLFLGHSVYVHCTAGMGRSPLTVLGYLALVERQAPEAAIQIILAGRPEAVPSWEAFEGCRYDLTEENRQAIERRAHELHEQGVHQSAEADWQQAEAEILREVLITGEPAL